MTPPPAPPTILLVEDKRELRDVLRRTLTEHGFAVLTAADGEAGLATALDRTPDLLILDVGLPGQSGFEVARAIRARGVRVPILMLTALAAVDDRLTGFDAGADDYLAKPFNFDELVARVRALLRRTRADANVIRYADLACDPLTRRVVRAGQPLELTRREYLLLEYLMRHPGRPITREEIAREAWQGSFDPEKNSIEVYVSYLRTKLDAAGGAPLLHTVRRVGYMLREGSAD